MGRKNTPASSQTALSRHFPEVTAWQDLPHLHIFPQDGKVYHYVRVKSQRFGKGSLLSFGPAGSPAWCSEYDVRVDLALAAITAAEAKHAAQPAAGKKKLASSAAGTLRQAVDAYVRSDDLLKSQKISRASTRASHAAILGRWCDELLWQGGGSKFGDCPIDQITFDHLEGLLNGYKNEYGKAKNFRGAIRPFYEHLYGRKLLTKEKNGPNPTLLLKVPTRPKNAGSTPLTPEDLAACRKRWEKGTMERAAVEILFRLGPACADAIKLGPANVKTGKNGKRVCAYHRQKIVALDKGNAYPPYTSELEEFLPPTVSGPWLKTSENKPFTGVGHFSQFVRTLLQKAGVRVEKLNENTGKPCYLGEGPSAHGFRKLSAISAAYRNMPLHQMKAVFGWDTLEMPDYYTQLAQKDIFGFQAAEQFPEGWEPEAASAA
jgi:hypothetical protein